MRDIRRLHSWARRILVFFSWALAFVFAILKELECTPGDDIFHHLVTSLTVLLTSRVMAPSFAMSFMKQYHCETCVPSSVATPAFV